MRNLTPVCHDVRGTAILICCASCGVFCVCLCFSVWFVISNYAILNFCASESFSCLNLSGSTNFCWEIWKTFALCINILKTGSLQWSRAGGGRFILVFVAKFRPFDYPQPVTTEL